jgi:tetratricopeptide (TPR) repeat protein
MADPADDPFAGPASPGSPAAAAPGSPQPLAKAPRLHLPTLWDREDLPAALEAHATDADLEKMLAWARKFDGTPAIATEEETAQPAANPAPTSRRRSKFRKFDPETDGAEEAAAEAEDDAAADGGALAEVEREDQDRDAGLRPGGRRRGRDPRRALKPPKSRPPSLLSSLLVQLIILVFLGAGFLLGRATLSRHAPVTAKRPASLPAESDKEPTSLSAAGMNLIDEGIAAEHAGDPQKAAALFDQVRHSSGHVEGLDYQLAALAYQRKDPASALILVNRSIARNEYVSECYALRGLIMNSRGVFRGLPDFQAAAQADPFDAKSFFFWGEALRRAGKLREAVVHLREAAARAQNPWDAALYEMKVRLTQIELGEGKDLAAAIEAQLALPSPPASWLLTAAAQELHDGDYPAAAHNLERTRPMLGPTLMAATLRDYFFLGYADKPAVAPVFAAILGHPASSAPPPAVENSPPAILEMSAPPPAASVAPPR